MSYQNDKKIMSICVDNIEFIDDPNLVYFSFSSSFFPEIKEYYLLNNSKEIPFKNVLLNEEYVIKLRDFCNKVLGICNND